MSQSSDTPTERTRDYWERFATRTVAPYRGGLQCVDHFLDGWPGGSDDQDCPCFTGAREAKP